ncbi:MAG TPA: polysaccharide biosynthesis tyrosine autokinase [Opitutus sp.]|nr:polysaccharide biosynthesis tyrosine autokinase [Opitutus sp.]
MAHDFITRPLPKDGGAIDARNLVNFLRENQVLIWLSVLLGLVAAIGCVQWMPPLYTAHAVIEVVPTSSPLSAPGAPATENDAGSASLLKTVEQTIAGPDVLRRVIADNDLAGDPEFMPAGIPASETTLIRLLEHRISASLVRGTRLVSVEASSARPDLARRLAQSVIDEFFAQNLDSRRNEADSTRAFLTSEAKRLAGKLDDAEHRLQDYRERYGTIDPSDRKAIDDENLRHLHELLSDATGARLGLESERNQMVAALDSGDLDQLLALRSIAADPEVVEFRKQLAEETTHIAALSERYRPKHPLMVQARQKLGAIRESLTSAAHNTAQSILHAYQAAKSTEEGLRRELADAEKRPVELARLAIPYHALEREVDSDAAIYRQLLSRLKETDVVQSLVAGRSLSGSYVRLVEKPVEPERPSSPRLALILPAGLGAGLLLGLALALLRRALDDSVPSVDEAEACLGVSTLAVVPLSRQIGFHHGRLHSLGPGLPEAEAFRYLRTSLSLRLDEVGARATMFTSALSGEGKSCCSSNYAVVVAQSGLRTLLIDGDLRRPRLRQAFGLVNRQPGIADCLADPNRIGAAILNTPVPNLFVLGDCHGTPHAAELLARGRLKVIIDTALAHFDRVVVDTAPVAIVGDALHFARLIPTICLVVRARQTPRRLVRRVNQLLVDISGRPLAGVVLNKIPRDRLAGYHYYYHSSERYALSPTSVLG